MNRKIFGLFLFVSLIVVFGLMACSNKTDGGSEEDSDKITVTFWHSMSGENGTNFEEIVEEFNNQSDNVHIEPVYQGSYTDLITKIRAMGNTDEAPAIIQASGTNRKYLAESDFVEPMQKFIDEEDFDTSQLEENALNRYVIDDTLYSMPFSTSNAVMYYNKDLFKEAGLDPDNPPQTFSEIEDAAQKIKNATGNYGFTMATIGWYFEQLLANQGELYLDNDNGFSGEPTKSLVNEEAGQMIFQWLDNMNKAETFKNYGSDWEDPRAPFLAGQVGIYFDSSANTREMVKQAPFEIATAPLPVPDGVEPHGATVGGNSNYITNKVSEEEQKAAWEFIKYTVSPEVQAKWASVTGYFPVTKAANEEDVLKETYDEFPQMLTAVEVNNKTPAEPAMSGPLSDDGEQFRSIIEAAQEKVYEGEDPKKALDEAAEKINDLLN